MLKRNIRSVFITLSNTAKMEWFLRNIETLQLDVYSETCQTSKLYRKLT